MVNAGSRMINIGFIYICSIEISSFTYIRLFSFVIPNTGIDKSIIVGIIGQGGGGSMSISVALELIQSFNNQRSLMLLTAVCRRVSFTVGRKLFTILRDFLQLPKLFIEVEDKLFSGAFEVII